MTSGDQLQANQENALSSTGPKTEEGKAVSKLNALKHGLLSEKVLLEGENEESLIELGKRLRQEFNPASELEVIMVDRITANTWRLRRVMQVEKEMVESDCSGGRFGSSLSQKNQGEAFASNRDSYDKLVRYETSIERGIYKALHELQRIQAARRGEKLPAPVAIDIDVSKD